MTDETSPKAADSQTSQPIIEDENSQEKEAPRTEKVSANGPSNEEDDEVEIEEEEEVEDRFETIKMVGVSLFGIAVLVFITWLYFPIIRSKLNARSLPSATPTVITVTPRPTFTATITPTETPQPTATVTPMPISSLLRGSADINPPLPGLLGSAIVLDESTSVTAEPDLQSPRWSTSAQIAQQLGVLITESYYATFGPGSLTWQVDQPLPAGMYEMYVMDTAYSSSGTLDFSVRLGNEVLTAVTAKSRVTFLSTRGDPPQQMDQWRSIGIYPVHESSERLSISTSWNDLAENEIVAADRVLVVPLPASTSTLLSGLPTDRERFIMDDAAAKFEGVQFMIPGTDRLAWGDSFQTIVNPKANVKVTWEYPDLLPIGTYDVAIWVPENNGDAEVVYHLLMNGQEIVRTDGLEIRFQQGKRAGGQWLLLGTWVSPRVIEKPIRIALVMEMPANTGGEAAVDAVAFLHHPQ